MSLCKLKPPLRGCSRFTAQDSWKFFSHFSRDEVKTKWGVSDFIKAFIKFHGHVYLSKSLEKLSPLREKLEEQFKVRFQKQNLLSCIRKHKIWGEMTPSFYTFT